MRIRVPQPIMDLLTVGFWVVLLLIALAIAIWGAGFARILGVILAIVFGYVIYLFISAVISNNKNTQ